MNTAPARLILTLTAALTASAPAAMVGVNFGSGGGALSATDFAGVAPFTQSHWTTLLNTAPFFGLPDDSGIPTTVSIISGAASFGSYGSASGPDEILNNHFFNSTANWSFIIGSIPYSSYRLIVYDLDSLALVAKGINVGGTTFYTSSPDYNAPGYIDNNAATPFTYTRGTSTNPALIPSLSDYVQFDGLIGPSQTVNISNLFGVSRRIGGFQIVKTPEPTSCALLIGACGGLGMRRMRRRMG